MKNKSTALNLAIAGAVGALGVGTADAVNPFNQQDLNDGYNNKNTTMMGKMAIGEGKCGESKDQDDKQAEGKCGEGKCGESKAKGDKQAEGKCGEGKCGEGKCGEHTDKDDKQAEGNTMEEKAKDDKHAEGKCGEGKCGEGKCGH